MSTQLINILETSPTFSVDNQIDLGDTLLIRYLVFSFDLILLSTLNHAKLSKIPLFSFLLDKFASDIQLSVQNDFDFFHMRYNTAIKLNYPTGNVKSTSVFVDNYMHDETRSQSITIKYELQGNEQVLNAQKVKMKVSFGYVKELEHRDDQYGRFTIEDFHYHFADAAGDIIKSTDQDQMKKNLRLNPLVEIIKNTQNIQYPQLQNYNEQGGSFPVVYMTELNNLKYDGSEEYFDLLIKNLQPYNATNTTSKSDHLFICHDMKSGYAEDVKFSNNLLHKRSNSYRFNYMWHTGVFNYFSHKTISIPPRHWRELCRKFQVKCLGTFIIEGLKVNQTYYNTNQFALKLVYLAKKHQFDGYLLNIENQVKDVQKLKIWMAFLSKRMHEEIPGSMISWYDSINQKGIVDYQNEVNDKNKAFYELTDSFFTNYWWNDDKLKDDLKQAKANKTIYVGNDIWGRGTFGGGQFFTFKGIDQIEKFNKPNLVPALFAPAYTYEKGGQNSNAYFKANQDRLYRGVLFEELNISKWETLEETHLEVLQLNNQDQWHTGYFSQSLWSYKSQKALRINFLFRIKQNATLDTSIRTVDYKIVLRVRDVGQNTMIVEGTKEERLKVPLWKTSIIRNVEMFIEGESITPKSFLEIIVATSIDKVFDHETKLIGTYDQGLDWVLNLPITNIQFNSPFNTFMNMGHGESFFYKGKPLQDAYDYLSDYDLPHTMAINHPFKTSIQHHDAYIGGSSLIINQQAADIFFINMPNLYNYPASYEMKIAIKGGPFDSIYLSQTNGFSIFFDKTSQNVLENGWVEETYQLSKDSMKKMRKKFFKQLETTLSVTTKSKCLLGQVHLRPKMLDQAENPKQKMQLIISQSFKTHDKDIIYINLGLNDILMSQSVTNRRYLIKIDEQFAGFTYLQKQGDLLRGKLDQIPIKLSDKKIEVEVIDVESELRENLVLYHGGLQLKQLKQKAMGHRIRLTNY